MTMKQVHSGQNCNAFQETRHSEIAGNEKGLAT